MKKMSASRGKKYGDVKAVAFRYDCHPSTMRRMVQRGQIRRPVKIGNLTRWDYNQLDAADANRELVSEPAEGENQQNKTPKPDRWKSVGDPAKKIIKGPV